MRAATILPIANPGNDSKNLNNNRPIALTSCVYKTIWRVRIMTVSFGFLNALQLSRKPRVPAGTVRTMYVHCTYSWYNVRTMYVHCTYSARWGGFWKQEANESPRAFLNLCKKGIFKWRNMWCPSFSTSKRHMTPLGNTELRKIHMIWTSRDVYLLYLKRNFESEYGHTSLIFMTKEWNVYFWFQ